MINSEIKFTVFGDPKGKARPRFRRIGKFTTTYTPKETVEYENKVKKSFKKVIDSDYKPLEGPVEAEATCFCRIPKSYSKKKRESLVNTPCCTKPDTDNIIKSILDPLNEIAFNDDSQVCKISGLKLYGNLPRVEVTLKPYKNIIKPIKFVENSKGVIKPIRFI